MAEQEFTPEELATEEWRSVVGYFAGIYSVSSLGRIRRDKQCSGTQAGRILRLTKGTDGYWYTTLSLSAQERRYSVQSLVARAFIGKRPPKYTINHIDGIKTNNRPWNLEYITFSQNSQHAFDTGLSPQGENHGISKLTNDQVREIKRALKGCKHGQQTKIARQYGVNDTVISKIKRGEIWRHIAEE